MTAETTNPAVASLTKSISAALRERGFNRRHCCWEREGLFVFCQGQWVVLDDHESNPGELARGGGLGQPGFWRVVNHGVLQHLVFEIPSWVASEMDENDPLDDGGPAPIAKLLNWALGTRGGRVDHQWRTPDPEEVRGWSQPSALTVQARGCVRQGELILKPGRWALRIPILPQLSPELAAPRRRALMELAEEAQCRWAMARVGLLEKDGHSGLVAEVDFTGAPCSELLFSAGLDVLRHVVAWLAETAEALSDPRIVITSLASGSDNNTHNVERKTP